MRTFLAVLAVTALLVAPAEAQNKIVVFGYATQTYISSAADIGNVYQPLLEDVTLAANWRAVATAGTYHNPPSGNSGARPYTHSAYYIQPSAGKYFPAGTSGLFFQAREDTTLPISKGLVGTNKFAGVRMNEITKLSYWTSYPRASRTYANEIPVSLQLWLTNGVTVQFVEWQPSTSLVKFGQVMVDGSNRWQWNQWNVLDETHGSFRVYKDPVDRLTWSQFQAAYGDWYFVESIPFGDNVDAKTNLIGTGFTFQMGVPRVLQAGMGNLGNDLWYQNQIGTSIVDALEIGYRGEEWLYDFEIIPEPASMLVLGSGLLGMAGLLRRSRRV